jgi:hypothetical protein
LQIPERKATFIVGKAKSEPVNFEDHPAVSTRKKNDQPEHRSRKSGVRGMRPVSVNGNLSESMFVNIIPSMRPSVCRFPMLIHEKHPQTWFLR